MFCGGVFRESNPRAKEHVLKKSWIEALGHENTATNYFLSTRGELVSERRLKAMRLLTGQVCRNCNGGWMKFVDEAAASVLMQLAKAEKSPDTISKSEAEILSRWLLKTACVIEYVRPPHMRHIPKYILRGARSANFLPPGFISFYVARPPFLEPMHELAASALDEWLFFTEEPSAVLSIPQSQRMKFAVQYDNIVLGCAWITTRERPLFRIVGGMHKVMLASRATYSEYTTNELNKMDHEQLVQISRDKIVNHVLLTLGAEYLR